MGEAAAEPAVKPLVALTRFDPDDLHTTHVNTPRASHSPATSPAMEKTTESVT